LNANESGVPIHDWLEDFDKKRLFLQASFLEPAFSGFSSKPTFGAVFTPLLILAAFQKNACLPRHSRARARHDERPTSDDQSMASGFAVGKVADLTVVPPDGQLRDARGAVAGTSVARRDPVNTHTI
jgi:hypothetical protein